MKFTPRSQTYYRDPSLPSEPTSYIYKCDSICPCQRPKLANSQIHVFSNNKTYILKEIEKNVYEKLEVASD